MKIITKRRFCSWLLALALFLTILPLSANANTGGDAPTPRLYLVPHNDYDRLSSVYGSLDLVNSLRPDITHYEFVRVNGDGSYTITLQYNSYSLYEYIQIIDPAKMDDIKAMTSKLSEMLSGNFGEEYGYTQELVETAAAEICDGDSYNQYYLHPSTVTNALGTSALDQALDIGYLTFTLPELPDEILIRAYAPIVQQSLKGPLSYTMCIALRPNFAMAMPLPAYNDGDSTLYRAWTDASTATTQSTAAGQSTKSLAATTERLNALLNENVAVSFPEGIATATFTLTTNTDTSENITEISLADNRDKNYNLAGDASPHRFVSGLYGATFNTAVTISDNSFQLTLDEDALKYGVLMRVKTNKTTGSNRFFTRLRVNPEAAPVAGQLIDAINGVTLDYAAGAVSPSSTFEAYISPDGSGLAFTSELEFTTYTKIMTTGRARFYHMLLSYLGKNIVPNGDASLVFDIPQEWDIDRIVFLCMTTSVSTNMYDAVLDKETRKLTYHNPRNFSADFILGELATPLDIEADITENGVYAVDVSALHGSKNQPSMANGTIKGNTGYLDVSEDGTYLYVEFASMMVTPDDFDPDENIENYVPLAVGYILHMMNRRGEGSYGDYNALKAEYLSHHNALDWRQELPPKFVKFKLTESDENGYYTVGFIIPPMNYGERWVRLQLKNPVRVDEDVNPLAVYDKSVIAAEIYYARNAVSTVVSDDITGALISRTYNINSTQLAALEAAIATAQAVYDIDPTDEATILGARDALRAAVASLPKLELNTAITAAGTLVESLYVADSWAAFTVALEAAQGVSEDDAATQTEIDDAADALTEAIANLALLSAQVNKTALEAKIADASAIASGNYTGASYAALQTAITAAQGVRDNVDATQLLVNNATSALQTAINSLVIVTTPLQDAIAAASAIASASADYEAKSYAALQAAIAAAQAASNEVKSGPLTAVKIDAQLASLTAATAALAPKAELKHRLADGTYSLEGETALYQFATNSESMGNPAIDHSKSYVEIANSGTEARVHLFFGPLTAYNHTGYLRTLDKVTQLYYDAQSPSIVDHYDIETAQVHEDWGTAKDNYREDSDPPYPKHLSIPVTLGEQDTTVHVFVPVMESISAGSGDQLARLRIDWSGFDVTGSAETADLANLTDAIAGIPANADGKYTAESYAALTASVAAGQYLADSNAALTVTSELADARIAAIQAATAALIALPVKVEVAPVVTAPTVDAQTGKATASVEDDTITAAITGAKTGEGEEEIENPVIEQITINAAPAEQAEDTVTEVAVSISVVAVTAVSAEKAALVIDAGDAVGSVTLSNAALAKIVAAAADSEEDAPTVTITITADAAATLTLAQSEAGVIPVGKTPFAVVIAVDDMTLTGEAIPVTVTVTQASHPASGKKYVVWHVKADGSKTKYAAEYDDATDTLTFTATI
ncbi:MAG: FIVAR domain-containing protein [Oscillospiraceae bacterium]|jgi:hypothetical protein|nr:FIVAR domain-containing protein [Oscillospiraceae bacterium]